MNNLKRFLALMLAMCMMLTAVPFGAFATESTEAPDSVVEALADDGIATTSVTLGTKPADGTVSGEPFNDDASLSDNSPAHTNHRIPGLVKLNNGTLVATADIRYDYEYDGGGSDIVVSRSEDDGETWNYSVVAYLGDQGNVHAKNASTMMDPVIITDGTNLYLLYDLFPAGYSLGGGDNTTYKFSATGTGFDSQGRLLLGTTYNSTECGYYLDGGKIYDSNGNVQSDYTVDEWFNVYENGEKVSNLFFVESPFFAYPTSYVCMQTSADGGENWSDPELVNIKHSNTSWQVLGPGSGIVTSAGELAFTVYNSDNSISLVHGKSGDWTTVKTSAATNESSIVELSDGTIRAFVKNNNNVITYVDFTKSGDSYTAGSAQPTGVVNSSSCMISSMVYSKQIDDQDVVMVCCPSRGSGIRNNGKIHVFKLDSSNNMTHIKSHEINGSGEFFAYSDMAEMTNGDIALLYEDGCLSYSYGTGVGYSHIAYTTVDPVEDLALTFDSDSTAANKESISLGVGETVEIELNTNVGTDSHTSTAADVNWVGEAITTKYPYAQLGTSASFDGSLIDLSDCLYTFTKDGDLWQISGSVDGTTVHIDAYGHGGYPNRSAYITSLYLTNGDNGGIKFHEQASNRFLHFWDNNDSNLYWDQCSNDGCTGHNLRVYKLVDTTSTTALGGYFTQVTDVADLESGEEYLIVGHTNSGGDYAMHPSTSTSNKYAHLAKVTGTFGEHTEEATTITITGKTVGTTTVEIGGTTYTITVKNEGKEINMVVGQSVTDTIEGSAYTMDDAAVADESVATIDKVETKTVAGETEYTLSTNVTAIENGKTYVLYNKAAQKLMNNQSADASVGGGGTTGLALSSAKENFQDNDCWTITVVDGGYYVQDKNDKYLTVARGSAGVSDTAVVADLAYDGTDWTIGVDGEYLNDYGGAHSVVAGWSDINDTNSQWEIYEVVATTVGGTTNTEVTFIGLKPGTTTATVGDVKYSIIVEGDEREINLVVGQTVTDVIENADYTMDDVNVVDPSIATIDNVEQIVTPGTTVINPVTEIVSGKQYLLVNTSANKTMTATTENSGLELNGTANAANTNVWTIETSGDAYTVRYGTDGGYLTVGSSSASISESVTTVNLEYYSDGEYWYIEDGNGTYALNNFGGSGTYAAGWSGRDDGSKWMLYEVVTTSDETDTIVTFTGHKVGQTTATVGGVTYTITVENDVRDITLHVGQTQTFYIDGYSYDAGSVVDSGIAKLDSVVAKDAKLVSVDEIVSDGQYLIVASQTGEVLTDTAITLTGDAGERSALVTEGTASVDSAELWTITGNAEDGYTLVQNGKYLTVSDYHAAMSDTATALKLTYSNSGWMICDDTTWESLGHNEANYYLRNGIADADYAADALGSSITNSHSYWYIYKIVDASVTEVTFTGVKSGETTATVGHVTFNITVDNVVSGDISDFNNIVGKGTYSDDNTVNPSARSDLDMTGKKITSLRITEGAEFQLDVDVTGYESVTWTTDDSNTATVDSTGMVTAVTAGYTHVTATVVKNGVEESIRIPVTVVPSLVEGYADSAITSVFYYIEQTDNTDPYYTMFLNTESTTEPVEGHRLVKVSEGEVIWYERPTNSAFAWVWTADPWEGYALTKMGSTGSINEYYPLRNVDDITELGDGYVDVNGNGSFNDGTDSEYYYTSATFSANGAPNNAYKNVVLVGNDGGASWRTELDALLNDAILVGINVYPNYGCDGAMSNTRWDHDGVPKMVTAMTFISDPMPHITKTVNGVLPTTRLRKDFEPYTDGMVATVGEYVYFQIDVTLERPTVWADEDEGIGAITYTDAMITDTVLPGAYFYAQANDTNMDGVISGDEISEGTDVDITAELNKAWGADEQVRKISKYLVYAIQTDDIPKFIINNTADLTWKYQSHYSTGALAGKADAKASITVVGYAMDNVVIDFGQKVVYTGLDESHLKYADIGTFDTMYGKITVAPAEDATELQDDSGTYYDKYVLTYEPTGILLKPDAIQLRGTYKDLGTQETVSKVINGFVVYPATTVYYEEGFMLNDASTDWNGGAKATMNQTFELLGQSQYKIEDNNKVLTGITSVKQHAYGYDPMYGSTVGASGGSESTASAAGASTTFTFTGTGFDLYANCDGATGDIAVQVRDVNNIAVRMYLVDTKVGEAKTDSGDSTDGQTGSMYSLPVISEQGLAHGTYTVNIVKLAGGEVKLDGVRIYNTFDESPYMTEDSKAESPFAIDLEDLPEFYELRDYVLSALNISDTTSADYGSLAQMAGQIYAQISSDSEAPSAVVLAGKNYQGDDTQNLLDNGPKNELYLHAGESLVFNVKTSRAMQIGLKAPAGATGYSITGSGKTVSGTLNSTVDMFYALGNTVGTETTYTITITNTGSAILSVTDLKICDDPNAAFVALEAEDIKTALVTMGYGVAENATTGASYDSVSAALAAAQSGETVKLLTDCTESSVLVTPGVTLDLNGFELTTAYAAAFDTAHIVDKVGTGCMITGEKNLVLDEQNAMLPVYTGNGYIFTLAGFGFAQNKNYTGTGIEIQALACPVNMEAVKLLQNGGADNNIEIVIRLSWNSAQASGSQEFKFTDDVVASVYSTNQGAWNTYGDMFTMTISGFENVENVKAEILIASGTDVQYISDTCLDIN